MEIKTKTNNLSEESTCSGGAYWFDTVGQKTQVKQIISEEKTMDNYTLSHRGNTDNETQMFLFTVDLQSGANIQPVSHVAPGHWITHVSHTHTHLPSQRTPTLTLTVSQLTKTFKSSMLTMSLLRKMLFFHTLSCTTSPFT